MVVTVEEDATTIVFNGGDSIGQMIDFCCLVDDVGKPTITATPVFKRVLDRRLPIEVKVVFDDKWFDKCVESFVVTEDGSIADDDEDDESHY